MPSTSGLTTAQPLLVRTAVSLLWILGPFYLPQSSREIGGNPLQASHAW